jgi:hypothetical protein
MIGETFSPHRIVEKIGGSGMGVMYKAEDAHLDRFIALDDRPGRLTALDPCCARHRAQCIQRACRTNRWAMRLWSSNTRPMPSIVRPTVPGSGVVV